MQDSDGVTHIPDGALVIERGNNRWSALVEVKTGRVELEPDQVTRYLDLARRYGFDGLFTISNQIVADPHELPYKLNGTKARNLTVRHLSWWQVLTEAIVQHRFRGIDDPDQAWILGELIRYLTDERSGASGFQGMGEGWVKVRDSARNGTLRSSDAQARAVVASWEQLIEYLCLNLSQELGVVVRAKHPRTRKSTTERLTEAARSLADQGTLRGAFRVPGAVGRVELAADLKASLLTTSVSLPAPEDRKRPLSRIKWLLRQLDDAPGALRVDVHFAKRHEGRSELLRDCRDDPGSLLLASEPTCQPRSFVLALTQPMRAKAGSGDGSFVAETRRQAVDFYRDLVQNLRPPRPTTPKLPADEPDPQAQPSSQPPASEGQVRREHGHSLRNLADLIQDTTP